MLCVKLSWLVGHDMKIYLTILKFSLQNNDCVGRKQDIIQKSFVPYLDKGGIFKLNINAISYQTHIIWT